MSSPLAAVSIEVTADDDPARREVAAFTRSVNNLSASIKVDADTSALKTLPGEVAGVGTQSGKALGDGIRGGVDESVDGLTRDVNGKLRNSRGQFVAAGVQAGRALGEGIEAGAESSTSGLGSRLAGPIATGLGLIAAGAGIAGGALTLFGLKSAADIEQVAVSFNSLTGSVEEGQKTLKELQAFAATTPFEFPDVAVAAKRLLAMGQAAGISRAEVQSVLTTIGNVASVTGGGAQALDSVTLAMGQIASSGKVTLENLNQISEAMPGFSGVAAIAAAKGISTAEAMELISSGTLNAQDGIDALLAGMAQFPGAAGAMEAQSKTLLGVFSTFKDTLGQSLTEAFTPVIPDVKDALTELTPILGDAFKTLGPALGETLSSLLKIVGPAVQALSAGFAPLFSALGEALSTIDLGALIKPLAALGTALAPVLGLAGNLIELLVNLLAPALTVLSAVFGPVIAAISQSLTPIIQGSLIPAIQKLAPLITTLATQFGAALGDALLELLPALLQIVPILVDGLLPVLVELLPSLAPLIVLFTQLLSIALKIIVPLATMSAEFSGFLILKVIVPLIKFFADTTVAAATAISKLITWLGKINFKKTGSDIGGGFTDAFKAVKKFFDGVGEFFADLFDFIGSIPGRVKKFLASLPEILADAFARAVSAAFEALGRGIALIYLLVTEAPGKIMGFLSSLGPRLVTFLTDTFNAGVNIVSTAIDNIVTFVTGLGPRAIAGLINLKNTVLGFIGDTFQNAKNAASNGVDSIVSFIFSLPDRIRSLAGRMLDAGATLINNLMNGLAGFGDRALGFLGRIVDGIKNFINNNVLGALERGINSKLPFNVSLPRLADGAVIASPTVALVGEAGPEVVIPLTNPARAAELAASSGLLDMLRGRGGGDMPVINVQVFATLGTGEVLEIVDQRVDVRLGENARELSFGPRW